MATDGGLSPAAIGLLRWSSLALLLGLALSNSRFRTLTRAVWPSRRDALLATLVGAVLFGPAHLIYYNALTLTSTIEGAVLGTSAPVWTTLFALFLLKEPVGKQRALAIGVGFVGAYLISVGMQLPELNQGHTGGNLLYLSGVLAECACGVLATALVRRSSGISILFFQVLGAVITLSLGPLVLPAQVSFVVNSPTPTAWAALAYLVLFPGLICFSTWYVIVEKTPLSLMVLSILLQPPLCALVGWWGLGEPLTVRLAIGTALIFVALALGATEKPAEVKPPDP